MSRTFFTAELEGVATWWRIERRDGVALGFTSHDRDLWFDGARVSIGAVDWATLERAQLYAGSIGTVAEEADGFTAELLSAKAQLAADPVPRTSPTCRASFCGPGCTLSPARFTGEAAAAEVDHDRNAVTFAGIDPGLFAFGSVRWVDGPQVGVAMEVVAVEGAALLLDTPLDTGTAAGLRATLRQGCDHTLATCHARFANAANFQGEPFLPGNDLLTRYPAAQ